MFHKIKFTASTSNSKESEILDSIQAWLEQRDVHGQIILACFDMALVQSQHNIQGEGIKHKSHHFSLNLTNWCTGHQIAQVHIVFHIPSSVVHEVSPALDTLSPTHLAYVEWFSPITATPDPKHQLYRVSRQMCNRHQSASIIPVDSVTVKTATPLSHRLVAK